MLQGISSNRKDFSDFRWWIGKPGMGSWGHKEAWSMGSQRVGLDWATELNWETTVLSWQDQAVTVQRMSSFLYILVYKGHETPCEEWRKNTHERWAIIGLLITETLIYIITYVNKLANEITYIIKWNNSDSKGKTGVSTHPLYIARTGSRGEQYLVVSHRQKSISPCPLAVVSTNALNGADTLTSLKGTSNQLTILVFKTHS